MLHVGSEGTGAVVILVVAFAGIDSDEVVLDGTLQMGWHIVVDSGQANWHADGFVATEITAVGCLHLWGGQVDAGDQVLFFAHIAGEDAAEAMVAQGADGAVAYDVACGLLAEKVVAGLGGVLVFFHYDSD